MLVAYKGDKKIVNRSLLLKAFEEVPSLILDCGNAADVHALFQNIREDKLHDVYVINLEAIYRFRSGLQGASLWAKRLKIKQIIVTTADMLYSYDDEIENDNVLEHCWEIMKGISKKYPIKVGITKGQAHQKFAEKFADRIESVDDKMNVSIR
jgi:hypothetical protein